MIISIINQKGGVGKTTTAVNLAAALTREGRKVVLLDIDPQQDALTCLASIPAQAVTPKTLPKATRTDADFVIIDCPPSLSSESVAALKVSDYAVLVVQCHYLAVRGLSSMLDTITEAQQRANPQLKHKVLFTMLDNRAGHYRRTEKDMRAIFGRTAFDTSIPQTVDFPDAFAAEQSIFDFAPKSVGAKAYRELAREVLQLKTPKGSN